MSALSVSTSRITSPRAIRSPSRLRQALIVPSSMVSESFGILISRGMRPPPAAQVQILSAARTIESASGSASFSRLRA
jgi:hypothetical protein